MSSLDNVLSHLPNAKRSGKGWKAHCPAHEDRKPSLSVSQGDDGTVLIKCHAGCTTEAILAAIGLEMRDLFPPKDRPTPPHHGKPATNGTGFTTVNKVCTTPPHHDKPATKGMAFATANDAITAMERAHGNRSATWTYKNAEGEPVGLVVRWDTPDGKQIRPVARHADGWHIGAMQEPRPLYMLPEIAGASRVIVCEGEKCAEAARSIGFTATTSSGGSQAATKTDWWPLAGKEVWILPDNDMPGRQYAEVVADILTKLTPAPKVRIVELPDLAEGEDIADWIEAQGDAAEPDTLRGEIEIMAQQAELLNQTENDELDCQPFPVHALPEPIQSFVSAGAKAILCDPSYLALPLLTAIAAAIGNTRRLELKRGWAAPAILWTAVVGESGTAKTPSFTLVMRPVKERERKALSRHKEEMKRYEGELAHWEKEMTAWKREKESRSDPPEKPAQPHAERFLVSDTTIEALAPILLANPRGLLLARDELAGWFGSFDRYAGKGRASADSASWLSMFNAESIVVDRKSGIPRTIYVPHACICLTGGIQPAILQRALSPEHRESGLASRFLLACPPRKGKKWTEADIDPDAETKLVQLFEKLYELKPLIREDGEPGPVLVQLNAEAKMAWIAYYNSHAAEQSELTGDLAATWSKLEEYAARLALVIHFARWASNAQINESRLDLTSMNMGIELARWFKREARRIYAMLDESDTNRDQRRLLEWIIRKGGTVTPREVQQSCRWLKALGAAETALEELVKAGRGTWQTAPTTGRGGRPSRSFVIAARPTDHESSAPPGDNQGSVDVDSVDTVDEVEQPSSKTDLFGSTNQSGPYRERF